MQNKKEALAVGQPISATVWNNDRAQNALLEMFEAAVAAADPRKILAPFLPELPRGRCVVVGAGKAAAAMAVAVESAWPDAVLSGAVVVPYGHACPTKRIAVREAAHPVPDAASEAAALEMLSLVNGLTEDDLVLALISGGGSSVLALPVEGVTLADKQAVNRAMLTSGLDIRSMNAVRSRLSAIKGGKLAEAAGMARVVTLAISDIPGDDIGAIASGPTIPVKEPNRDLSSIADRLRSQVSSNIYDRLVKPVRLTKNIVDCDAKLIATPQHSLSAAAEVAQNAGLEVIILGDSLEGESKILAKEIAALAKAARGPVVLLSGGETTVTLTDGRAGCGGRNTEFALALAIELAGANGIWAIAADTDGEDGASGGGAGAIVTPDTCARAVALGLDPNDYLHRHDSGSLFKLIGDLIITGPTFTNVNDFRAVIITPVLV